MGFPYNELIAPAILLDNPGITREEFCELLNNTHSSNMKTYKKEEPWNFFDPEWDEQIYHEGLYGLAELLKLEYTPLFKEFKQPQEDENKLFINPPLLIDLRKDTKDEKIHVLIHKKNILHNNKRIKDLSFYKLKVGSVWSDLYGIESGLVVNIFSESGEDDYNEDDFHDEIIREYDIEIRPIEQKYEENLFKTEEELWMVWPEFHPNNKYNWSQSNGSFSVDISSRGNYRWKQIGGRYYLDKSTFDLIPASFACKPEEGFGFVDLILTSYALKHKAWKLLSYRGLDHLTDFLKDFPDAKQGYQRAVWDSHTSLNAKMLGLTISEFLRFRLL